ncbi:N-acetylmuramoyl-L-alanine amidase [Paenibacillus agilis]|uniref:N-acetylmuramoyl-L-alanine amidase n=1 Tax=Paenibacillus agilis TaxID=3020863 RepID=A0A559IX72_9BACL|nr:N-acetylmuramoyl-L-alanine amidase [Paenibacillus agilis]TVX92238.1 hypothetical protein FPZ44_03685 [Paenibacillus agilis]
MQIIQMGNKHTNYSSRKNHVPTCIVNHISAGTMSSMDNWFRSPGNRVSSAHFGIAKDGRIHQYLDIKLAAWTQGLTVSATHKAPAKIVRDNAGINPNSYCISIEHEGTDGQLTDAQFKASIWLHKHIQKEVKRIWGRQLLLDSYHVIGHFQIDPIRKASCPGPKFPWSTLYQELKGEVAKMEKITATGNGNTIKEALLINGKAYVPARDMGEALGATVAWDKDKKHLDMNTKAKV